MDSTTIFLVVVGVLALAGYITHVYLNAKKERIEEERRFKQREKDDKRKWLQMNYDNQAKNCETANVLGLEDAEEKAADALRKLNTITEFTVTNGRAGNRGTLQVKIAWQGTPGALLYVFKNREPHFDKLDDVQEHAVQLNVQPAGQGIDFVDTEVEQGFAYNYYAFIKSHGKFKWSPLFVEGNIYDEEEPKVVEHETESEIFGVLSSFMSCRESVRAIESETDYLRRQEERLERRHNVWVLRQRELETQVKKVASKQTTEEFMQDIEDIINQDIEDDEKLQKANERLDSLEVTADAEERIRARVMRLFESV